MKVSVSIPDDDGAVLDAYAKRAGLSSRSAAVQHAIRMLRHPDLEDDYVDAWKEWDAADDSAAWDPSVGDGLNDAAR